VPRATPPMMRMLRGMGILQGMPRLAQAWQAVPQE